MKPQVECRQILDDVGIRVEVRTMEDEAILCVKDEKGAMNVVAFFNDRPASSHERNFLFAHVLGHYFLHVQPKLASGEWRTSGLRETFSPMARYSRKLAHLNSEYTGLEAEADEFAASLLLPEPMLVRSYEKLRDMSRIAKFFDVDDLVVGRRLSALGLMPTAPANFCAAEDALSQEPKKKARTSDLPLYSDRKPSGQSPLISKAFAASSYSELEKRTASSAKPEAVANQEQTGRSSDEEKARQSLERIRNLARRIDRSVD